MHHVTLTVGDLVYHDVGVPTRFVDRWRGMRAWRGAMLLATCSVHGFGMDRTLTAVALDRTGRVLAVTTLRPGRVLVWPVASHVLELEATLAVPQVGEVVATYDRSHGGTSRGVCHSDRQSRRHL